MKHLPKSPADKKYQRILDRIRESPPEVRGDRFRAYCNIDFWFFLRFVSNFSSWRSDDEGGTWYGRLFIDHPFLFKKSRLIQYHYLNKRRFRRVFYNWPRFHFKTTMMKWLFIWAVGRDPKTRVAIITAKTRGAGEEMTGNIRDAILDTEALNRFWSDVFPADRAEYKQLQKTSITVPRPSGPKEPTFGVYSITSLPTSQHFDIICPDDVVTRDTVATIGVAENTMDGIRNMVPLAAESTWWPFVGTRWGLNDCYSQLIEQGDYFDALDVESSYDKAGVPIFRSKEFIEDWRKSMDEYSFSCQMLNSPRPPSGRGINLEAYEKYQYRNSPEREAEGKNIYVVVDPGSLQRATKVRGKKDPDFFAVEVAGLGSDGKLYSLDHYRERLTIRRQFDLIRMINQKWKPKRFFAEQYAGSTWIEVMEREMELEGHRFQIEKLPTLRKAKEERIEILAHFIAQGKYWHPTYGYGHGVIYPNESFSNHFEGKDIEEIVYTQEIMHWSPASGAVAHDDSLDSKAWFCQPETESLFERPVDTGDPSRDPYGRSFGIPDPEAAYYDSIPPGCW